MGQGVPGPSAIDDCSGDASSRGREEDDEPGEDLDFVVQCFEVGHSEVVR